MSIVIKVDNLSKQYRLGEVGTGALAHDINRWWHKIRGKENPYIKVGEINDRTKKSDSDYVWALKDINFEVKHGEVLGIVGRNGAGKSTLLKILSRTTSPTTGMVKIKGRVASLLEVGTGFHPELSGRENVFLNGAILGMRKEEIKKKFDEIVDFAGVERYIDTPVKRYSSGMFVRLAFAVAAHLESEILIVDEVLAVGDAEFQNKCLGKMSAVSKGEGRTILFVSHNLPAVKNLCNTGFLISNGMLQYSGEVDDVASRYYSEMEKKSTLLVNENEREGNGRVRLRSIEIAGDKIIITNEPVKFLLSLNRPFDKSRLIVSFSLRNLEHQMIAYFVSDETIVENVNAGSKDTSEMEIFVKNFAVRPGKYNLRIILHDTDTAYSNTCDIIESAMDIDVLSSDFFGSGKTMRTHDQSGLLNAYFKYY
ncbi:MAG TPA: polysaccharide ABC transporter ATP-binding protein [Chitinophagaceae bacterium]|nr:polysaccharide ABC transporter ATP-binding protein [Chitinophagaceae bacterium]